MSQKKVKVLMAKPGLEEFALAGMGCLTLSGTYCLARKELTPIGH